MACERGFRLYLLDVTSSSIVACVLRLRSCFELSKVASVDYFDDVSGFGVFLRVFRFGPLKAQ